MDTYTRNELVRLVTERSLKRQEEDARRLARYDEAIRLLRDLSLIIGGRFPLHHKKALAFLAAEPKEGR